MISVDDRVKIFGNVSNMARIGTKLCQNAFQTISDVSFFDAEKIISAKISDWKFCFSPIWRGFGRATAERMSKSACSSNFALDRLIERPVRPKILGFGENLGFLQKFSLGLTILFNNFSNRVP